MTLKIIFIFDIVIYFYHFSLFFSPSKASYISLSALLQIPSNLKMYSGLERRLSPSTHAEILGKVVYIFNPSVGDCGLKTNTFLGFMVSCLASLWAPQSHRETGLKAWNRNWQRKTLELPLVFTQVYLGGHEYTWKYEEK